MDSDRPVKQCTKCCIHAGMPAPWQRHGRWTSLPDQTHMASDMHLRFQARIWSHMTARRALNPCDNCITSDQNYPKQMLFHNVDNLVLQNKYDEPTSRLGVLQRMLCSDTRKREEYTASRIILSRKNCASAYNMPCKYSSSFRVPTFETTLWSC